MLKGLGYQTYKGMYWLDPISGDIEFGFHTLKGDKEINDMCDNKIANMETDELYIYCDNVVNNLELLEAAINVGRDTDSYSNDGYESAADEAYKPPLPGFESDNNSSNSAISKLRKRNLKPEDFVHELLTMDAIPKTYEITIKPVNSEKYRQEISSVDYKPQAPLIKRLPGYPILRKRVDKVQEVNVNLQPNSTTYNDISPGITPIARLRRRKFSGSPWDGYLSPRPVPVYSWGLSRKRIMRPMPMDLFGEMDEQVSAMAMDVDDVDPLEIFPEGVISADNKLADADFFNNFQDDFDDADIN
ncbi:hypothetical protein Ahy_B09g098527 [Arachis hypogaea]|uniref:PB1-like domain-containing protein n=2 Tax=Arachis hypogaea TaxID=3818 RepID=A0A444XS37_ARAHY|nr:hypothetical protein Ahy_B09g098527 [Arachis hypogaea]